MTRPDVAYAAHQLGKFNDKPGPVHWGAAKGELQYLWRTKDVDHLRRNAEVVHTTVGVVDDDFSPCRDTRRSVSGGAVMLGGGRDKLVLEGAEGDRCRVIRIRVCDAGRSCK